MYFIQLLTRGNTKIHIVIRKITLTIHIVECMIYTNKLVVDLNATTKVNAVEAAALYDMYIYEKQCFIAYLLFLLGLHFSSIFASS